MKRSLALAVLGLALFGTAQAEDRVTKPRVGKVGLRVVQVFPETQQALVYSQESGKHVVVGEGDRVGKYDVVEIDDDAVIVRAGGRELVLVVDTSAVGAKPAAPKSDDGASSAVPPPPAPGLLDPYGAASPLSAPGPLDPYAVAAPSGAIREVIAPAAVRAPGGPMASGPADPYGPIGSTAPSSPTAPPAITPTAPPPPPKATGVSVIPMPPPVAEPVKSTPIAPAPAPAVDEIRIETATIKRGELSKALADFDKLSKEIGFAKTADGVRLATIGPGSYFFGLGFRSGDVVTALDGAPLRSLDDAAAVYARLGSAKKLSVAVVRAGTPGTLRFTLK